MLEPTDPFLDYELPLGDRIADKIIGKCMKSEDLYMKIGRKY